ncbi:response regulator transcription factor [Vulgatibacter sp.]|uniref:response regulator transcription factor n=1 Tax=Vulgatibacter sp. TaxID=1971226 RepID=UPI003563B270
MSTDDSSILVVDDDATFRERLVRAFAARGLQARGAGDAEEAVALALAESPELAVVDLRMPGRSGLELVKELRAIDEATQVLVLTGYGSIATAVEAMRLGACNYLPKPADADEILAAFAREPGTAAPAAEVASLARAEWEHINRVLADCGGNISQAARLLGLHRRSLQRKLAKYPVPR